MSVHHLGEFGDFSLTVVVTSPPWYENAYIVRHRASGQLVVVDPGGDAERILAAVSAENGTPVAIWLTHGHPDHLGAAGAIEDALDIDTIAHQDELPVIAAAGDLARSFTGESMSGPRRVRTFADESPLTLGGAEVAVTHTPGHTPGGVCFDFGGFALTGDTLFRQGVGRTDLPGGSEEKLWQSIPRFLGRVSDDTVLFSGHGPEWRAADARRWWKFMV
ncbi:MBL fold metallo-hydrolase [Magnetospirillum aberrantis]|uniref:MBL fold metallo-hydrolase n=1 Tax=Magnetospirillum aberrantis SpK TaxID=908842 RepID=A0A7C9QS49_9PROT|nr:MBL fold metallo-hydrolase [Magnetospirillum aberrantis]NFV78841.1 MBL fold metallo-hydrolase [Magnetospirillum aberrantis SpK]